MTQASRRTCCTHWHEQKDPEAHKRAERLTCRMYMTRGDTKIWMGKVLCPLQPPNKLRVVCTLLTLHRPSRRPPLRSKLHWKLQEKGSAVPQREGQADSHKAFSPFPVSQRGSIQNFRPENIKSRRGFREPLPHVLHPED